MRRFSAGDFGEQRARMVDVQLSRRGITDERVLEAMSVVPREEFVDPADRRRAYTDGALSIGHGQTISQPWVVAAICQALETGPDDVVLEIGTGSGYSAAILARLCRSVVTCEIVPELSAQASERLAGLENVELICGDGAAEPPQGPFDGIAVHAAIPEIPVGLLVRLAEGGRLVAPIRARHGEQLTVLRRGPDGFSERSIARVRFVPLTGRLG
jgi:protein-L-isoaspartate(D-aspartate) O-methyltransferase